MPDNLNVPDLLARAQEQKQQQEQLVHAMQQSLRNPHTIERVNVSACAIAEEQHPNTGTPYHVLMVGTMTGHRYDIVLSPQALAQIQAALVVEEPEAKAA